MAATWDAIVIGGGHNGLVAGAYLARAGARTVILERRHKTGGAASIHEAGGGSARIYTSRAPWSASWAGGSLFVSPHLRMTTFW